VEGHARADIGRGTEMVTYDHLRGRMLSDCCGSRARAVALYEQTRHAEYMNNNSSPDRGLCCFHSSSSPPPPRPMRCTAASAIRRDSLRLALSLTIAAAASHYNRIATCIGPPPRLSFPLSLSLSLSLSRRALSFVRLSGYFQASYECISDR